jgi:hypothetical protein
VSVDSAQPPTSPRPATSAGGIPRGLSIGESWPAMVAELRADKASGRLDSLGRRLVEQLIPVEGFTEVGRLIGVSSRSAGPGVPDSEGCARIPGEVVAGWGRSDGRLLFVVADEVIADAPRNPAGAAVAGNVATEAFRSGAPLVSICGARRMRADLRGAESFMRTGLQLDLGQEQASARAIPKVVVLCGTVDLPVMLEMANAHYVVGGPGCEIVLPDGSVLHQDRLGELGWVDALCPEQEDVLAAVSAFLALLSRPGSALPSAPRPLVPGSAASRALEVLEASVADDASSLRLSQHAPGSLLASLASIGGRAAGMAVGAVRTSADEVRLAKLRRLCQTFDLPLIVIASGPGQEGAQSLRSWPGAPAILIMAEPADPAADRTCRDSYDAVLAWHDSPGGSVDAVIEPDATRDVVAALLADLAGARDGAGH